MQRLRALILLTALIVASGTLVAIGVVGGIAAALYLMSRVGA